MSSPILVKGFLIPAAVTLTDGQLHLIPNSLFLNNKLIRYQEEAK